MRTLEDVTQRVHGEYERKLAALEQRAAAGEGRGRSARTPTPSASSASSSEVAQGEWKRRVKAERRASDESRRSVTAAVEQLEKAHVELHRRSESLRQKTRTLYLIDRVLTLDATTDDPRELVTACSRWSATTCSAQRCSLLLHAPEEHALYPRRGARHRAEHRRRVTASSSAKASRARWPRTREPLLVQDVAEATSHPLLRDEYFTTGSFISFPLVYHGTSWSAW